MIEVLTDPMIIVSVLYIYHHLHTWNLYSVIYQLHLNKIGKNTYSKILFLSSAFDICPYLDSRINTTSGGR